MSQEDIDTLISKIQEYPTKDPIEKRNILSLIREKMNDIKDFIPAEDKALYDSLIQKLNPPPPPLEPIDLSTIKSMLISLNQILL